MARIALGLLTVMLTAGIVSAQSSGNFSARIATMKCELNQVTGVLSGGLGGTILETNIQTPNSSQSQAGW